MLVNFQDAFIFVISAETEYIFASEEVGSMSKGDPSEDEPVPFSSASCGLTQQSLFTMLRAPFFLDLFWFFSCYFIYFSIFSIKMPPILVNTSPQSCSKSTQAVNNSGLLHVIFLFNHPTRSPRTVNLWLVNYPTNYVLCNAVKSCS